MSISGIVNAALLYRYLVRDSGYSPGPDMGGFVIKTAAAAIVMGALLWIAVPDRQFWVAASVGGRLSQLVTWVPTGIVVYLVCLYPNNKNYQLIKVPDLSNEIKELFELRKNQLCLTT